MLIRKSERTARQGRLTAALSGASTGVDRRAFLRRSGLAAGALAAVGTLPLTTVRKADAAEVGPLEPVRRGAVDAKWCVAQILRRPSLHERRDR